MASTTKVFSTFDHSDRSSSVTMPKRTWLVRDWRFPRTMLLLIAVEIGPTIAALALFGIADPDLYRTRLWQDGYLNGFNSSPAQVLLAYANHITPVVPLVWSQHITTFNLVISVLSMFVLLVKAVAYVMHLWLPLLSAPIHAGLLALYLYSTYAQLSPDTSDPAHPQRGPPWYITHSCAVAHSPSNRGYCRQAKASVAVAILLAVIFFAQLLLSLHSALFPSRRYASAASMRSDPAAPLDMARPAVAPPFLQKSSFVAAHPLRSNQPVHSGPRDHYAAADERGTQVKSPVRELWHTLARGGGRRPELQRHEEDGRWGA